MVPTVHFHHSRFQDLKILSVVCTSRWLSVNFPRTTAMCRSKMLPPGSKVFFLLECKKSDMEKKVIQDPADKEGWKVNLQQRYILELHAANSYTTWPFQRGTFVCKSQPEGGWITKCLWHCFLPKNHVLFKGTEIHLSSLTAPTCSNIDDAAILLRHPSYPLAASTKEQSVWIGSAITKAMIWKHTRWSNQKGEDAAQTLSGGSVCSNTLCQFCHCLCSPNHHLLAFWLFRGAVVIPGSIQVARYRHVTPFLYFSHKTFYAAFHTF